MLSAYYLCRRCDRWHEVTATCDPADAPRSQPGATAEQQRSADELEALSLARYHDRRRTDR